MPRARIDRNGIAIAKPGFDVDTAAIGNMLFTPQFGAMRLWRTDVVTVADYSGDGERSQRYRRAIVSFGRTFPQPPIVICAGIISGTQTIQTQFYQPVFGQQVGGIYPFWCVDVTTTGFNLWAHARGAVGNDILPSFVGTWRYFVFDNTLS